MRYFLDTEYNGWGGALISLALVPEDGGDDFYVVLKLVDPPVPWVARHVLPFLDSVPEPFRGRPLERGEAAVALAMFLERDSASTIVADWPEDIAQIAMLLVTGKGTMVQVPPLCFELALQPGFSTAANSLVPHNALHDARALRDHVLAME